MISWRITKYNPQHKNEKDEWTSCYDIGKSYNGRKFTVDDYMTIENAYIYTILLFMKEANVATLTVRYLEKHNGSIDLNKNPLVYTKEMVELFKSVHEENILEIREIEHLCRLILREQLWCKLESDNKIFVHFGYDYYMYIGCLLKPKGIVTLIGEIGLFIEEFESPYV